MPTEFAWDQSKADANFQKHGVTFEEAVSVFENPIAAIFGDEAHSEEEPREIIVGHSVENRLLLVCFVEHERAVRIISARLATAKERKDYEKGLRP
jgi:uncharacterized protein